MTEKDLIELWEQKKKEQKEKDDRMTKNIIEQMKQDEDKKPKDDATMWPVLMMMLLFGNSHFGTSVPLDEKIQTAYLMGKVDAYENMLEG